MNYEFAGDITKEQAQHIVKNYLHCINENKKAILAYYKADRGTDYRSTVIVWFSCWRSTYLYVNDFCRHYNLSLPW